MSSTAAAFLGSTILAAVIIGAALITRARRPPLSSRPEGAPDDANPNCKRCGRRIEVDPGLSVGALEGMHWLCFHLEYEHSTDPDLPCTDFSGCPWWTIRYYEERLRQLGVDPKEVVQQGIEREADERYLDEPREDG